MKKKELLDRLNELETRIWKIEHPPKYKYGDKYNEHTVTGIVKDAEYAEEHRFDTTYRYWVYFVDIGHELINQVPEGLL